MTQVRYLGGVDRCHPGLVEHATTSLVRLLNLLCCSAVVTPGMVPVYSTQCCTYVMN